MIREVKSFICLFPHKTLQSSFKAKTDIDRQSPTFAKASVDDVILSEDWLPGLQLPL